MRILIVEDEQKIASLLASGLSEQGFTADVAGDGESALNEARVGRYDAILLDLSLPKIDGLQVLRVLREENNLVPVLILSARSEVGERINGLESGADDFVPKPFSVKEVVARLRAIQRRRAGDVVTSLQVADLRVNLLTREVNRGTRSIDVTGREFTLLECLMRAPGRVFQRQQITEKVWGFHLECGTNLVDVYIKRLREKVDEGEAVKLIHTVRGMGYLIKTA
jgi:DNA-binding response OmpR family regulator